MNPEPDVFVLPSKFNGGKSCRIPEFLFVTGLRVGCLWRVFLFCVGVIEFWRAVWALLWRGMQAVSDHQSWVYYVHSSALIPKFYDALADFLCLYSHPASFTPPRSAPFCNCFHACERTSPLPLNLETATPRDRLPAVAERDLLSIRLDGGDVCFVKVK